MNYSEKAELIQDVLKVMSVGKNNFGLNDIITIHYEMDWNKLKEKWENSEDKEKPIDIKNMLDKSEFTLKDILSMVLEDYKELAKPKPSISVEKTYGWNDPIPCGGSITTGPDTPEVKIFAYNKDTNSPLFNDDEKKSD